MDHKTLRWKVIDGLQRMASIIRFLSGDPNWILSRLDDIDQDLSGKPAKSFLNSDSPLHHFYRRVENLTLPITVLRCDFSKKSNTNYLFTIFHRLNTGAMKLNNQEIRNCIYSGAFNNLLKELNKNTEWMRLNKMKKEVGFRFTKEELILRFFAFYDQHNEYGGRLAKFLNEYMADNRNIDDAQALEKKDLFDKTIKIVFLKLFDGKFPTKTPISVMEATLVGVAKNIDEDTLSGTLGYEDNGDPPAFNLDDVFYGQLGLTKQLAKNKKIGTSLYYSQASSDNTDAPLELSFFYRQPVLKDRDVYFYFSRGLSDGSPDFSLGGRIQFYY